MQRHLWSVRGRRVGMTLVGLLLVALAAPACSSSSAGTRSASPPPATKSAGVEAAVTAAVRSYFGTAIASGEWQQVALASNGALQTQAKWLASQDIAAYGENPMSIQRLQVTSVSGSHAVVAFDATQTTAGRLTTYGGPVSLTESNGTWKVDDYTRNGRSVAGSIFTTASGTATQSGVTVKVIGVQLEAGHADVWVRIENRTSTQLQWDGPIVIVDAQHQQLGRGALFVSSTDTSGSFEMMPGVSVFGDFLVDNVTLPLTTTSFTLLVGATVNGTQKTIDLSVPVRT